jgi:hypothetical protein
MDAFGQAQRREKLQHAIDGRPTEPEPAGWTVLEIAQVALARLAHGMAGDDHASAGAESVRRDGILRARIVLIP